MQRHLPTEPACDRATLVRHVRVQQVDATCSSGSGVTVRTQLRVLEGKGHVRQESDGLRYVYMPSVPRHSAWRSALKHLVETFFDGTHAKIVAALLGGEASKVTDEELDRILELARAARGESR